VFSKRANLDAALRGRYPVRFGRAASENHKS